MGLLLSIILLATSLLLIIQTVAGRRHKQLFKALTRYAAHHFTEDIPRTGRRRGGSVCFVTGMPRATCTCADCQGGDQ